jgi:hypothetical protein
MVLEEQRELQDLQELKELQEQRELQDLQVVDLPTEVYGIQDNHITPMM